MNNLKAGIIWLAIGVAAGFAAFAPTGAMAEDVHVCSMVEQNAKKLYAHVEAAPDGTDLSPLAAAVQAQINPAQAEVLIDGLRFLIQNWGNPALNANSFAQAAKQVCEARYGQIADRNNT